MTKGTGNGREVATPSFQPIRSIEIKGFKSLSNRVKIEIRPLTLLAGANSSGKSSAVQPLLLLKQTLEVGNDPGPLCLDGPNVSFSSSSQVLSPNTDRFDFALELESGNWFRTVFVETPEQYFALHETTYGQPGSPAVTLTPDSDQEAIYNYLRTEFGDNALADLKLVGSLGVFPFRGFLSVGVTESDRPLWIFPNQSTHGAIGSAIHIPALRRRLERLFPRLNMGPWFPGTFEDYAGGLIHHWQEEKDDRFRLVVEDLRFLELTWRMRSKMLGPTLIELEVGRSARVGHGKDYVRISDVGVGVSQILPLVVALHAASPNQLVYVEQPEIHLHPKAQVALARVLVNAAKRGVRVLVETHSESLLLGTQIAVAEGQIDPSLVKLHWFGRDNEGNTHIDSADLDQTGAFGPWPEDFSDVSLSTEKRYLDAAGKRLGLTTQ